VGLEKGDRFSIWAPNIWGSRSPRWWSQGQRAGAINTRFKGREAVRCRVESQVLFTVTDFLDADYVDPARPARLSHRASWCCAPGPEGCMSLADYLARGAEVDDAARAARSASVRGDDLCHILFTSGTTGAPKGAMLVHSAVCKTYLAWSDVVGLRTGDRFLVVFPFLHSAGLHSGILACIMKGACNVPHPVFDVPSVMRRVQEERISVLPGPPAVFQAILNHPDLDSFDLSSLRLAITARRAIDGTLRIDSSRRSSRATGSPSAPARPRCAATTTIPRPSPTRRGVPSPTSRCWWSTNLAPKCPAARRARSSSVATT
jgi:acyl-CoA synthetase (AMP-forming)/AMP-acid ligase II